MLSKNLLDQIAETAIQAALAAGSVARQALQQGFSIDYKAALNIVTSADLEAEKLILAQLKRCCPEARVLSEEFNSKLPAEQLSKGPLWIIDPIDGTTNFSRGLHYFAVSIAFAFDGQVQFGIVHAPLLNETYCARRGQGATLNGVPIKASGCSELKQALVATGFPYDRSQLDRIVLRAERVLANCQDLRRLGACSLDLCAVACGRMDAYYEDVEPWDMAAGQLIAAESGAFRTNISPNRTLPNSKVPSEINGAGLLVCAPGIAEKIVALLE